MVITNRRTLDLGGHENIARKSLLSSSAQTLRDAGQASLGFLFSHQRARADTALAPINPDENRITQAFCSLSLSQRSHQSDCKRFPRTSWAPVARLSLALPGVTGGSPLAAPTSWAPASSSSCRRTSRAAAAPTAAPAPAPLPGQGCGAAGHRPRPGHALGWPPRPGDTGHASGTPNPGKRRVCGGASTEDTKSWETLCPSATVPR